MDTHTPIPTIFLSYCWADKDDAESIDKDFQRIGVTLRRDVRDVDYGQNIKEFMNSVGSSDFVILIISDKYLRSFNCMYEVNELLNSHEFEKRILPVLAQNAYSIFKPEGRETYYLYWKEEIDKSQQRVEKTPNSDFTKHGEELRRVVNHLPEFFNRLTVLKLLSLEELRRLNYEPMLRLIYQLNPDIINQIFTISKIEDLQQQEQQIDNILDKYPENIYARFHKARLIDKRKEIVEITYQQIITEQKLRLSLLSQELNYKQRQLTTLALEITEKKNFMKLMENGLQKIIAAAPSDKDYFAQTLLESLDIENTTRKLQDEFAGKFMSLHQEFIKELVRLYPSLSPSQLRICVLLRMSLNSKQIAEIMHLSLRAVENHRLSIRKTLLLDNKISLQAFLVSLPDASRSPQNFQVNQAPSSEEEI